MSSAVWSHWSLYVSRGGRRHGGLFGWGVLVATANAFSTVLVTWGAWSAGGFRWFCGDALFLWSSLLTVDGPRASLASSSVRCMDSCALRRRPGSILLFSLRILLGVHGGNSTVRHLPAVRCSQYLFIPDAKTALRYSTAATLLALFVFGWVKAMLIGSPKRCKSAVETLVVGGVAAAAAYFVASAFDL